MVEWAVNGKKPTMVDGPLDVLELNMITSSVESSLTET
jgi:hypothetical protein